MEKIILVLAAFGHFRAQDRFAHPAEFMKKVGSVSPYFLITEC